MNLMSVPSYPQQIIKGLIIIAAVAVDMYSSHKMSGLKRGSALRRMFRRHRHESQLKAGA